MQLIPGAEPFRMDAGANRVLLLHGFASTPFELRYLAEKLAQAGHTSVCPLLPGHGTHLQFFARTGWQDWFNTAQQAFDRLLGESDGRPVTIVGQSLGALLGLRLAALWPEQVRALACLATPLSFNLVSSVAVQAYRFSPLRLLDLKVPRAGGADISEPRLRRGLPGYEQLPLKAVNSFRKLQTEVRALLGRVRAPLLALHGAEDHTAPLSGAEELLAEVGSRHKELQVLPTSWHVLSLDVERAQVARYVEGFLARHTDASASQGDPSHG